MILKFLLTNSLTSTFGWNEIMKRGERTNGQTTKTKEATRSWTNSATPVLSERRIDGHLPSWKGNYLCWRAFHKLPQPYCCWSRSCSVYPLTLSSGMPCLMPSFCLYLKCAALAKLMTTSFKLKGRPSLSMSGSLSGTTWAGLQNIIAQYSGEMPTLILPFSHVTSYSWHLQHLD